MTGLPEATAISARNKWASDHDFTLEIFKALDIECQPLSIYRIGKMNSSSNRLIKIVLPSSSHQSLLLNRVRQLKKIPKFRQLFIRPSLNAEERKKQFEMREECRRLSKNGTKVQIIHGKITPLLTKSAVTDHNLKNNHFPAFTTTSNSSSVTYNQPLNNWRTSSRKKSVSLSTLDSLDSWRTVGFR